VSAALLRVAALLALVAGADAGAEPAAAATAATVPDQPLIWTVSGPHGAFTLVGSIHALRAEDHPLPPAYDAAYAAAARLVLEVEVDGTDAAREQRRALAAGRLPRSTSLREVLGAERWAEAERLAAAAAVDLDAVRRQEPWLAALTLSNQAWRAHGLDARRGLDRHYLAQARADGKPVRGLERAADQLGLFDRLPPSEQQRYLIDTLRGLPTVATELDAKIAAWRRGDLADWEDSIGSLASTPALRAALLDERHARWLPQLERLLEEPTPTLVVVGTLHLVGEGSVLAELARRGHRVERVGAAAR
jgi:hypothetical protein